METKKAVVFGCRGQLGTELAAVFAERGYQVTGFDRSQVDIGDNAQVEQAFAREDPCIPSSRRRPCGGTAKGARWRRRA